MHTKLASHFAINKTKYLSIRKETYLISRQKKSVVIFIGIAENLFPVVILATSSCLVFLFKTSNTTFHLFKTLKGENLKAIKTRRHGSGVPGLVSVNHQLAPHRVRSTGLPVLWVAKH